MFEYYSKEDLDKALVKLYDQMDDLNLQMLQNIDAIIEVKRIIREKYDN